MLLYIMLYIVLAYLMLFAALTNAACLNNASSFFSLIANAFYFHALSFFISVFLFASCTVLLICLFFLTSLLLFFFFIYINILYERAMSSQEK